MPETPLLQLSHVVNRPSRRLLPVADASLVDAVASLCSAFYEYQRTGDILSRARWDRAEFLASQAIAKVRGEL